MIANPLYTKLGFPIFFSSKHVKSLCKSIGALLIQEQEERSHEMVSYYIDILFLKGHTSYNLFLLL